MTSHYSRIILPLLSLALVLTSAHAAKDDEDAGSDGTTALEQTPDGTAKLDPSRNVLWDAGFDTGFGNGFWTVIGGGAQGPSRRDMWKDGTIALSSPIASRAYHLPDGTYTMCAWVKRNPSTTESDSELKMEVTNLNYYRDTKKNSFVRKFPVAKDDRWQRVGWTFSIVGAVRPLFHVTLAGDRGVLVDAVCLIPGSTMPDNPIFTADVEAGFDIPEETRTYVDGEKRVVDLMTVNHTNKPRKAGVTWEIYDHREDLTKEGVMDEEIPAGTVLRKSLPVQDLPYGGYRLASSVRGASVLGDGLLGILPVVDSKSFPYLGLDASIRDKAMPYTLTLLKKLGITQANIISSGAGVCRWGIVESERGKYQWSDDAMLQSLDSGLLITPYLSFSYQPPSWTAAMTSGRGLDIKFMDEKGFLDAYCTYVDTYIRHYKGKLKWIMLEDEVHGKSIDWTIKIYSAACAAAKKASVECGNPRLLVGINGTGANWWETFLSKVPKEQIDLVSSNTAAQPRSAAEVLNTVRKSGLNPEFYHVGGVGQRGPMRRTSMPLDRGGAGFPAGIFAVEAMLHAWMSRPYGTEDPKDGPLIYCGFYDQRTLTQTAYLPFAGKTGVEFDNSPGIGWLGMSMFKHEILGMRPVRDPRKPYSTEGVSTAGRNLYAYSFRNDKAATIVLCTDDLGNLDSSWKFSGLDFKDLQPRDLFANPLPMAADGSVTSRDLPVYLTTTPDKLEGLLRSMGSLKADIAPKSDVYKLEAGPYLLEIDPALEGILRLWRTDNGKRKLILDRFTLQNAPYKPEIHVNIGRNDSSANLAYGKRMGALDLKVSAEGCQIIWKWRNVTSNEIKETLRLRIAQEGAGSHMVIQEGNEVKSGKIREDYGSFTSDTVIPPPEKLADGASHVKMDGFATFDLPAASGLGFAPKTGFLWKTQEGQAFLEASYTLEPTHRGGGKGGKYQSIQLRATVK